MTVKTKLQFKDYIRLIFLMTYRRPLIVLLSCVGFTFLIPSVQYFAGLEKLFEKPPFLQLIIGLSLVILLPVTIYWIARKSYFLSKSLQEDDITYEITDDKLKIIGESFNSELSWDKIYKVTEFRNWILIFQYEYKTIMMPKSCFGDDLLVFKKLITGKRHIRTNFSWTRKAFGLFFTLLPLLFFMLLGFVFLISIAKPEIYLIPENYSGEILVFFDQPDGTPLEMEGKKRIYRIPENGILFTQFKWNRGAHNRKFFMIKNNTKNIIDEVSAFYIYSNENDSDKISVIDKRPYYFTDAEGNEYLFRATRFIVGKRKDFEKYDVEIKTDSIIENVFSNK